MLKSANTGAFAPRCATNALDWTSAGAPSTRWFHGLSGGNTEHADAEPRGRPIAPPATAAAVAAIAIGPRMIAFFGAIRAAGDASPHPGRNPRTRGIIGG